MLGSVFIPNNLSPSPPDLRHRPCSPSAHLVSALLKSPSCIILSIQSNPGIHSITLIEASRISIYRIFRGPNPSLETRESTSASSPSLIISPMYHHAISAHHRVHDDTILCGRFGPHRSSFANVDFFNLQDIHCLLNYSVFASQTFKWCFVLEFVNRTPDGRQCFWFFQPFPVSSVSCPNVTLLLYVTLYEFSNALLHHSCCLAVHDTRLSSSHFITLSCPSWYSNYPLL